MKPLAYKMRPTSFIDVVGQEHLVGKNGVINKMLEKDTLFSMILSGPPGIGKTTISEIIASKYELNHAKFNASTDNKASLKNIIDSNKNYGSLLLIIDEIHRMKKDIQDYLLKYVEDGSVIMIGLTTLNPYHSINPAIRSRCHILELKEITDNDIIKCLHKAHKFFNDSIIIDDEVYEYIANISSGEIRTAINMLEMLMITEDVHINISHAVDIIQKPNLSLDSDGDNYYDTLSGLQKSIRGSDVDASLHYLAKLIILEDLDSIIRRLLVIAYEDIGLANPSVGPRTYAATQAALIVGFPEARIPLANIVVDLSLSPKSNSTYLAIDSALQDLKNGETGPLPHNLKNLKIYKYPHDYPNAFVLQQYMPDNINKKYYIPKETGKYERAIKQRYDMIQNMKK